MYFSGLEFTITKDDNLLSEKKVSNFQLTKLNNTYTNEKDQQQQQQQELFMVNREEDLLNPIEQNNNFLHVDNSQILINDHMRNSTNSFNGLASTTRSMIKPMIVNDDAISCSSEVSYNDGSSFKQSKKFDFIDNTKHLAQIPSEINNSKAKAEWYHTQGFEARKRGEFQLAIDYYAKALEIYPNHFKVSNLKFMKINTI